MRVVYNTDYSNLTGTVIYAGNIVCVGTVTTTSGTINGNGLSLPHVVKKAASANIRNSHDGEINSSSGSYVKVKTITLPNGLLGTQRFLFDLKIGVVDLDIAYGKIYRNGVALGSEQTNGTATYVTKSQDITQDWNPGDTCELWIKTSGEGQNTYVRNFRIAYDDSPTVTVTSSNS